MQPRTCKDTGRAVYARASILRVSRVYWTGIHRKVPLRGNFCGGVKYDIPRSPSSRFARRGASEGAERGVETKQAGRFVLSRPIPVFAKTSKFVGRVARMSVTLRLTGRQFAARIGHNARRGDGRALFANQISLRLNSLQTRGRLCPSKYLNARLDNEPGGTDSSLITY